MYVKPKHLGMVRQHVRFFFCLCPLAEISLHFLFQRHSRKKKGNIETYRISHLRQNSQNKVSPLEYYPWPVPVANKIFCIFYHLLFPGQMGTQTAIQKKKKREIGVLTFFILYPKMFTLKMNSRQLTKYQL